MLPCPPLHSQVTTPVPVTAPPATTSAPNVCQCVINRTHPIRYLPLAELWECLEIFRQLQPTGNHGHFATPVQPDNSQLLVDASVADEIKLTVPLPDARQESITLTPLHPYYDDVLYLKGHNRPPPGDLPRVDVQGGQLLQAIQVLENVSQANNYYKNIVYCALHFLIRAEHPGFFITPAFLDGTQLFINGSASDKITLSLHSPGHHPQTVEISPLHPIWCYLRWRIAHISGMGHAPEITIAGSTPGTVPAITEHVALGSAEMSAGELLRRLVTLQHPSQYTQADHACIRALLHSITHERNTASYCTPLLPDYTRLRITKTATNKLFLSVTGAFLQQPVSMVMSRDHPAYRDICRRLFFHRPLEITWSRIDTPGHMLLFQRNPLDSANYYAFAGHRVTQRLGPELQPHSAVVAEQRAIYQSTIATLPQPEPPQPTLAQRIHLWLPQGKPVPAVWEHYAHEENAQHFNHFLDKLSLSKSRGNPVFRQAVADLLQEMESNPALRKQVFATSYQASLSCSDRATLGWNTIQTERLLLRVKQAPQETPPIAFVALARQIFHLKCIDKIARNKVKQLYAVDRERGLSGNVDEIEVFLAYQIQLGKKFPFPQNFASEMMFHTMSRVTEDDIKTASQELAHKDEHKFYNWLTQWKTCQEYLLSLLPEPERDKVTDDRAEMFDIVLAKRRQECRDFVSAPDAASSSATPSARTEREAIELERALGPQAMAETDGVIFGQLVQTRLGVFPPATEPSGA